MSPYSRGGWLFGRYSDLLWGAGLGYALVFVLILGTGGWVMSVLPPSLMMLFVVLVSMPHYGATILRVYEREDDRRAYALFSKYSTLLLGLLFLWGVRDVRVGLVLFTLYLTWSPWHYTGQNYGITLMFLGRHGVTLEPQTKLLLRGSFLLSYLITFLFIHGPSTVGLATEQVRFLSLNLPALPADFAIFIALLSYCASTAVVTAVLLRNGARRVAPAVALMVTQCLWFVVPAAIKNWLPYARFPILTTSYDAYAFTWIALGHAAQYLWITAYFARASERSSSTGSFYIRTLMTGCAIWALPLLLFAPGLLGKLPYDVGLASVTAAVVNLHHFVLDGAIWKLRESRIGKILLNRTSSPAPDSATNPQVGSTMRWPLATAGLLSLALLLYGHAEYEFGLAGSLSRRDIDRAETAVERLADIGRDSPYGRLELGALAMREGDPARAARHLEAGVRLFPTSTGWTRLGEASESLGRSSRAIEAFEEALALDPDNQTIKMHLALACAEIGQTERARTILQESGGGLETIASRRLRDRIEKLLESRARSGG